MRRSAPLLALLSLAACAPARPHPAPAPAPGDAGTTTTLYLIGDAGGAADNPVLVALRRELARDPRHSVAIFLGDNAYPDGIPVPDDRDHDAAVARLRAQLDAVRAAGARAIVLPGNHDWGAPGDGGALARQEALVAQLGAPAITMLPAGGCPGPAVADIDSTVRIVALDTEWWLRTPAERARAASADCLTSEEDVVRALGDAIAGAGGRRVVVAAHHPLASVGLHGERLGWRGQLFPLRDAWGALWLPLPLIGTVYQLARATGAGEQDLGSPELTNLRRSLGATMAARPPLAYVAGHEHNLQVLRGVGARWSLVSGAGSWRHESPVIDGSGALYARAASGFMRLELPRVGAPRLAVVGVDERAATRVLFAMPLDEQVVAGAVSDSVVVVPNADYRAGWLHRALLGANYRALWATPIAVPVLDLRAEAGGLRPTQRGGSQQTHSLRFRGGDGREYVFRSLDKDPSPSLPEELRETIVHDLFRDQTSAYHPGAALAVAPLLDAAGIRHARPRLVMLPDDTLLGPFRAEFAGRLGIFEERPGEGFDDAAGAGAVEVLSSDKLFERMRKRPETRVDAVAFLSARLFDDFVGDRDRHRDQWRWGRFGGDSSAWEPIPRDRDMAFVKQEGLLLALTRQRYPQLVGFGADYPSPVGLNWNAREIDRRLLSGLDRAAWDSAARALQSRITDSALDAAVRALPPAFAARDGDALRASLRARRDRLPSIAARYYAVLAREVEVHGTDRRDDAEVTRHDDGSVDVTLATRSERGVPPYFHRRFLPDETREIRIFLEGGDDRAVLRGAGTSGPTVRIMGGPGDDVVADSSASARRTRLYDDAGRDTVLGGRLAVDRRPYVPPPSRRPMDPPRDWGREWRPAPWVSYGPDVGLFVGGGRTLYRYGFRAHPYASRMTLQAGYAVEARKARAQFDGEFRRANRRLVATLLARMSGIEVIRFYGLGNGTPADRPRGYYLVHQTQLLAEPGVALPLGSRSALSLGAVVKRVRTDTEDGTLLGATRPYGSGLFAQVGARAGLSWRRGGDGGAGQRGLHVEAGGAMFPALLDVRRPYGETYGTVTGEVGAHGPRSPTLAVRGMGRRIWGTFPFYEAAFVGGGATLRGWDEQRFAGRAGLVGNAELRVPLARLQLVVPSDVGVFGLADAGRVSPGDGSDAWHTAFGGGVWLAPLTRSNTVSVAVAKGRERTATYVRLGFAF